MSDFFEGRHVSAFFSDRSVDFALNGRPVFTLQQKDFLSHYVGDFWSRTVFLRQRHGSDVLTITEGVAYSPTSLEADSLITRVVHLPLAIRTADCLPVFLFDPELKGIALIHAGWRGSRKGIVKETIQKMTELWGTRPAHLKVALGPAIRPCCYRVGEEFQQDFPNEIQKRADGFYLDLGLVNRNQLLELGVSRGNIFDCGFCTCCDSRFFSYRRDGYKAGRMISVMMLRES